MVQASAAAMQQPWAESVASVSASDSGDPANQIATDGDPAAHRVIANELNTGATQHSPASVDSVTVNNAATAAALTLRSLVNGLAVTFNVSPALDVMVLEVSQNPAMAGLQRCRQILGIGSRHQHKQCWVACRFKVLPNWTCWKPRSAPAWTARPTANRWTTSSANMVTRPKIRAAGTDTSLDGSTKDEAPWLDDMVND